MTTRSGFLTSAVALGAAMSSPGAFPDTLVKPPVLRRGDRVGLIAPASPLDPSEIDDGVAHLASFGLVPVLGEHARAKNGYLAGTDTQRAADFNTMARDSSIRAIVALRGGYGSMRILDALDYDAIRRDPKIVMGYSDITAIVNAIATRSGVIAFHGPVASHGSSYSGVARAFFQRTLMSVEPIGTLHVAHPHVITSGRADGLLAGGNLTLAASLAGTPYAIPSRDTIFLGRYARRAVSDRSAAHAAPTCGKLSRRARHGGRPMHVLHRRRTDSACRRRHRRTRTRTRLSGVGRRADRTHRDAMDPSDRRARRTQRIRRNADDSRSGNDALIMSENGGIIGISDHGGWAVLVTAARDGTLLDRRRVELVDDSLPSIPHHHEAQGLPPDEAVALVERVRVSAEKHAVLALDAVAMAVPRILGVALRNCQPLPPTIAERITDYRARNVADWVMYRRALAAAAEARGWPVHWYDAKKVLAAAIPSLRPDVGPPWNKDHKLAMAAAIYALNEKTGVE